MNYNNKRLSRFSKFINYTIAIGLCGFLIAFSNLLIADVDNFSEQPTIAQFKDFDLIIKQEAKIDSLSFVIGDFDAELEVIDIQLSTARNTYDDAKTSFNNWLAARSTIGNENEDTIVRERANQLDEILKKQRVIELERREVEKLVDQQQVKIDQVQDVIYAANDAAYLQYEDALHWANIKSFLIRLAIVLPILLLSVFFLIRFRKHRYWSLFTGFNLFALYAFFFGLVPYLPSYGGYIRYTVGILLIVFLGILAINKIRQFIERKRDELKVAQVDRANNVQLEMAEKALDAHMCPSCGKDFVIRSFKKLPGKGDKLQGFISTTNYCRYCGLILFKDCGDCGTENFVHLPFCSKCGTETTKENAVA